MFQRIKTTRRACAEGIISLAKRRRWFADDAQQETKDATPAAQGGTTGDGERKFTQADIDGIVKDRVRRARETAAEAERQRIFAELDIDDLAAAKALILAGRGGDKAVKEANDKLAALTQERDAAVKARDESDRLRRHDRRVAVISTAAAEEKAIDPADVVKWLEENKADDLNAAFDADDKADADKIKTLIGAVKTAKAHYFKLTPGSPSNAGGRAPTTPNGQSKADVRFNL